MESTASFSASACVVRVMSVTVDVDCPVHGAKAMKRSPSLFSLILPSASPSLSSLPSSAASLLDWLRDLHATVTLDSPLGLSPLSLKRTLSAASSQRVSLPALYAACLILLALTSLSVSSHFFLSSSAALPLSLSFTSVPSLPRLHLDHLRHTLSPLLNPTRRRLTPVRVEESERQAGLVLNPYILSGYAHLPPLFSSLPCVIPYQPTPVAVAFSSTSQPPVDPFADCVSERLLVGGRDVYTVIVSTYEEGVGRAVQQQLYHNALSVGQMAAMRDAARQRRAVDEYVSTCTAASPPCTLTTAASHLYSLTSTSISRYWVDDLQVGRVYTFAVQLFNGSHLTAPFVSQPTRILPQQQHYERERSRASHYLTSLFPPPIDRRVAPFEAADALCPAAFQRFVSEYRQWHVEQVARLVEVRDDPAALSSLLSASTSPPRLLVSVANSNSGLSDRTHGLLGVYMVALLTRRVLLLADEWSDILYSMQPSLSLRASSIAPHLNHSLLAGLHHTVPFSYEGMPIDALNSVFPSPVTSITSIRGMLLRFLMLSKDHGGQLRDLGLTGDNIVGCVYHSLWTVRLSTLTSYEGYETGYSTLLRSDVRGVGVQIRTWNDAAFVLNEAGVKQQEEQRERDREEEERVKRDEPAILEARERRRAEEARRLARTTRQAQIKTLTTGGVYGYFHCAADVSDSLRQDASAEEQPVYPVWLLLADDERLRSAAVARWGRSASVSSNAPPSTSLSLLSSTASATAASPASQSPPAALLTFTVPELLGHSSLGDYQSQLLYQQHAIVEQTLFSLCAAHVISRYSGFGRIPAVLAMRGPRVYGVSHIDADRERSVCMDEEMDGMSVVQLAQENSWL